MTQEPTEDHFQRLTRLLELEAEAEAERALEEMRRLSASEAERRGRCLLGLAVRDEDGGLGGRVLLTLGKRNLSQPLPWTSLSVGSPVLLSEEGASAAAGWRGVVSARDAETIQVALAEAPEPEADRPSFRLDLSSDEVSRRRQRSALEKARTARGGRLAELRDVLLGRCEPEFHHEPPLVPLDPGLDQTQREAVRFALGAEDVAILHGPPGTGKTTTVVELVRQCVRRGERVLCCAPSNLAVDNLLEKLLAAGEKAVRLGHPARVLPELRERTLDLMVAAHPDVRLARKLAREARELRREAERYTRAKPQPGERRELRREADELMADSRRLEAQAVERVLDGASVICATTTGLDSEMLGRRSFDLAVVDEACQSTEPGCWPAILRARRLVLAGDHCQLPPTVVSEQASRAGFGLSLQERLVAMRGHKLSRMLGVQYRMHGDIMEFPSNEFYDGALQADPSVREHLLAGLPGVAANELTLAALEFVDTAGASYDEEPEPGGESRRNPQEAELAARKVRALLEAGVPPGDIGVIAPYSAQVRLLRELLAGLGLEVDSVDGFQGREKEAIVVSMVRSNPECDIGFLSDVRRMNVAMTRARRKLLMIGDSATVGAHPFYRRLLEHLEKTGAYRTVWEEF